MTAVFYISGHGFGHASRSIEVINALIRRRPDALVQIRTNAARWLFDLTVRGPFSYVATECDTGIVQIDSLHLDEQASVERALAFMTTFEARVAAEAGALRELDASLVVADIPPLGVAAAARAAVPTVAMGNFTWDWAYAAYSGTTRLVDAIARAYAQADLALRLPMWGGFGAFSRVVDLPFIARHATREPAATREALGVPAGARLVLPSFGGHGLDRLRRDCSLPGWHVLFDVDEQKLYAAGFRYEDMVHAADAVVTKPGYGIIAECLATATALLYTSRGHFIEYDVLVAAMPRFLRTAYIDPDDLFGGRWHPHLDALLAQPPPPDTPATDGAERAADLLLELAVTSRR